MFNPSYAHYASIVSDRNFEGGRSKQPARVQLSNLLLALVQAKQNAVDGLQDMFPQYPDAPIFDSLLAAGEFLAPASLAQFGDDRNRFPAAANVQALAETYSLTHASHEQKIIKFRRACNRDVRHIAQQFALRSLSYSVWASASTLAKCGRTADLPIMRINVWPIAGRRFFGICGKPHRCMMSLITCNDEVFFNVR